MDTWEVPASVIIAALVFLLMAILAQKCNAKQSFKVPPVVFGLPLNGSVHDFISACHQKHGDTFTWWLLAHRMTFLRDPASFNIFFRAPESQVSFQPAVEMFTAKAFGMESSVFFPRHKDLIATIRSLLAPTHLPGLMRQLASRMSAELAALPDYGQADLVQLVQDVMFAAAVDALFGPHLRRRHGHKALLQNFVTFEEGFEAAASPLPHLFLPRWRAARGWLVAAFRESLEAGDLTTEPCVAGEILRLVSLPQEIRPNALLAVLWASQTNSIAATFWTLGLLLLPEHAAHLNSVQAQVFGSTSLPSSGPEETGQAHLRGSREALRQGGGRPNGGGATSPGDKGEDRVIAACVTAALDKRGALASCVGEALRMRGSVIGVRVTQADVPLPSGKLILPKGHLITLSPSVHFDPRLYHDPLEFNPHRWTQAKSDGRKSTTPSAEESQDPACPSLAFGSGRYGCPGRFFAVAEVGLLVALILTQYDVHLLSKGQQKPSGTELTTSDELLPPPDCTRLVGIRCPTGPCHVSVTRRHNR